MAEIGTEIEQTEISSVTGELQRTQELLRQILSSLEERIKPVLGKSLPVPEKPIGEAKQTFELPLAVELDTINESLKGSVDKIQDLLDRIKM